MRVNESTLALATPKCAAPFRSIRRGMGAMKSDLVQRALWSNRALVVSGVSHFSVVLLAAAICGGGR